MRFAQPVQMLGEIAVVPVACAGGGGVDLAAQGRTSPAAARIPRRLRWRRRWPCGSWQSRPGRPPAPIACIIVRGQIMRQVDHEAGVPPGRAFGKAAGLQAPRSSAGVQLVQAPGRRQPGKPAADDGEIGGQVVFEHRQGSLGRQDGIPSRRDRSAGQAFGSRRRSIHGLVCVVGQIDPDGFQLGVLIMRVDRVVAAAKARLLVAAKRRGDVALAKAVDGHGARPDRPCAADGAFGVGGEDRGAEAVLGVIGDLDRLVKAVTSITDRTGPKISSRARTASLPGTSTTVASTKAPSWALPPITTFQPVPR